MARLCGDEPPSDPGVSSTSPGVFSLADSGLSEFPAKGVVKGLRDAVELDLSGNKLKELPFGRLPKLESLESLTLTGNRLSSLPDDLGRCDRLRTIYAGANNIVDLSPALEAPVLLHLGLAHNKVEALPPPETCAGCETLMSLDLAGNSFCSLTETLKSLAAMPALRMLRLVGNPVSMQRGYRESVLQKLPALRTLDDEQVSREERAGLVSAVEALSVSQSDIDTKEKQTEAEEPTELWFEVRVEDLAMEPDPTPEPEPNGEEEGDGDAEETGDVGDVGDENGDETVPTVPKDLAEFWVQVLLPEGTLETPRIRRTPGVVEGDGDEGEEPAAAEPVEGEEETEKTPPPPYFSETVMVPVSVETRDAFVNGVTFELWRREPNVPEKQKEEDETDLDGEEGQENIAETEGEENEENTTEPSTTGTAGDETVGGKADGEGAEDETAEQAIPDEEVVYREYMVGTSTVYLSQFLNSDDEKTFSISEQVAFTPAPPLFDRGTDLETRVIHRLEDAPAQEPVGSALVMCTLHVREELVCEAPVEGDADEGETADGETGEDATE